MFQNMLLKELFYEHQDLAKKLVKLENLNHELSSNPIFHLNHLEDLLGDLQRFVIEQHHRKEELELFPLIQKLVPLQKGGPRCTFFMELKLQNDVTGLLLQEAKKRKFSTDLPVKYDEYVKAQSPLLLPLEEHWAGELALAMIHQEITKHRASGGSDVYPIQNLISKYLELLILHSRKEDECLFVISNKWLQ